MKSLESASRHFYSGLRAPGSVFGDRLRSGGVRMRGEDFAKYENPKCFPARGGGSEDAEKRYPNHSPRFQIEEGALASGVRFLSSMPFVMAKRFDGEFIKNSWHFAENRSKIRVA